MRSTAVDGNAMEINDNLYEPISPIMISAGTTLVVGMSANATTYVLPPSDLVQSPIAFAGTVVANGSGFAFPTVPLS